MDRSSKDKQMAAHLKARGIERTQRVCAACYRVVSCEGAKSRDSHTAVCRGGRGG